MDVLFSLSLFVSAFLLFWVQLMVAKLVLPLLGGSAAVWNTCLVFFQITLLLGYGYAHYLSRWVPLKVQVGIQVGFLCLCLLRLPLRLADSGMPPSDANPIGWLWILLMATVGLPFFGLSITAPLLQRWFALSHHPDRDNPYFLYAASNLGSFLGLLSYPLAIEPLFPLAVQSQIWTAGYGVLVVVIGICGVLVCSTPKAMASTLVQPETSQAEDPALRHRLRWIGLAFIPSSLLLGVTTYITTDLASVPLLWAIPLAIYLVTFALVFARKPLLPSPAWISALPALVMLILATVLLSIVRPAWLLLPLHLLTFFAAAWICHGELARQRPHPRHLTQYYWWIALGGSLGGIFNALLAPWVLSTVLEYPLVLVFSVMAIPPLQPPTSLARVVAPLSLGILLPLLMVGFDASSWGDQWLGKVLLLALWIGLGRSLALGRLRWLISGGVVILLLSQSLIGLQGGVIHSQRSFFGVYRVVDEQREDQSFRWLLHGSTLHGKANLDPDRSLEPLTYFTHSGPVGQFFALDPVQHGKVAILGLGIGTLAAYAQPDQSWTFYEIDPLVERLARDYFDFLDHTVATTQVIWGDARLSLAAVPPRTYSLMVMDAFSSDAIPIHLITREAIQLYLDKLTDHGLLVFNITNRYLDLAPILARLAQELGLSALHQSDQEVSIPDRLAGKAPSHWAVLGRTAADLKSLSQDPRWQPLQPNPHTPVWTDEYSDLLRVLRLPQRFPLLLGSAS